MNITDYTGADNQGIGQNYANALVAHAEAKSTVGRLERLTKRVYAQCFIAASGSVEERKNRALLNEKHIAMEDELIQAETAANVARARADGLAALFEEWRTTQANSRAEMNLR